MLSLVRGQFPRRELSCDAVLAAPRPKVARCGRGMDVITLSKLMPRFAPLAGLAVELLLGAHTAALTRCCGGSAAAPQRSAPFFRWQLNLPGFFRIPEVGSTQLA
jgi:hypothetical protein